MEKSIRKMLKSKIIFVISLVISLLLSMSFLVLKITQFDYQKMLLMKQVSNQKLLIQGISKDTSRLYAIIQAFEKKSLEESNESAKRKIRMLKFQILKNSNEIDQILIQMKEAKISSEDQKNLNIAWKPIKDQIKVIQKSEKIDKEFTIATLKINNYVSTLIKNSDKIFDHIIVKSQKKMDILIKFVILFCCVLIILIAIVLFSAYKYVLIPFENLYNGIFRVGLFNQDKKIPTNKEITPVVEEIQKAFNKVEALISLIENINRKTSFQEVLEYIYEAFRPYIPYNYIGIALIEDEYLIGSYGISDGEVENIPKKILGKKALISETSLQKVIESGYPRVINDLQDYLKEKKPKEYNQIIFSSGIRSSITFPLIVNEKAIGVIFFSSIYKNIYSIDHVEFLRTLGNSIALSFEKNIFVQEILYSSILALAKLAESRDEDTGNHILRMSKYSRWIAEILLKEGCFTDEINHKFIEDIEKFSPLHDIGKVGVKDEILLKPSKLTNSEFNQMKKHVLYGAQVLQLAEDNLLKIGKSLFSMGRDIALFHHEKWNGRGYPNAVGNEKIPLSARIVSIADVFDALTSKRIYKSSFSFDIALEMIISEKGEHFDPQIIECIKKNQLGLKRLYLSFNQK